MKSCFELSYEVCWLVREEKYQPATEMRCGICIVILLLQPVCIMLSVRSAIRQLNACIRLMLPFLLHLLNVTIYIYRDDDGKQQHIKSVRSPMIWMVRLCFVNGEWEATKSPKTIKTKEHKTIF